MYAITAIIEAKKRILIAVFAAVVRPLVTCVAFSGVNMVHRRGGVRVTRRVAPAGGFGVMRFASGGGESSNSRGRTS
jgi:hypothetical protein